jgi:hypothetical protein
MSPNDPQTPEPALVSPAEYISHYHRALIEGYRADSLSSAPIRVVSTSLPGIGIYVRLEGVEHPVHTIVRGVAPTTMRETREFTPGNEEAAELVAGLVDKANALFPERMTALWDSVAMGAWDDVVQGTANTGDKIFLNQWIKYRTNAPHLTLDDAERLFGDTPQLDLSGEGPLIDWGSPGRAFDADPEFQRQKRNALSVFHYMLNDAMERYCGAIYVALLDAQRRGDRER